MTLQVPLLVSYGGGRVRVHVSHPTVFKLRASTLSNIYGAEHKTSTQHTLEWLSVEHQTAPSFGKDGGTAKLSPVAEKVHHGAATVEAIRWFL